MCMYPCGGGVARDHYTRSPLAATMRPLVSGGMLLLVLVVFVMRTLSRYTRPVAGIEEAARTCSQRMAIPSVVPSEPTRWLCLDHLNLTAIRQGRPCVVYSFGINYDFSFDDFMTSIGCEVHSFDPSMKMAAHVRRKHPLHTFQPIGIGTFDGEFVADDANPSTLYGAAKRFPVMRLASLMRERGHKHLDVLRLDVEGGEWSILESMLAERILVGTGDGILGSASAVHDRKRKQQQRPRSERQQLPRHIFRQKNAKPRRPLRAPPTIGQLIMELHCRRELDVLETTLATLLPSLVKRLRIEPHGTRLAWASRCDSVMQRIREETCLRPFFDGANRLVHLGDWAHEVGLTCERK
jgi:hypothetical protein